MLLFWSAGLLIFILGIQYYWGDSTVDINVHDTYYVIPSSFIFIFLTGIMGLIGFLYWGNGKLGISLHPGMVTVHTIITITCILLSILIPWIIDHFSGIIYHVVILVLFVVFILGLISQTILIFNLI